MPKAWPNFDLIWAMCAKHSKPVMIHIIDSYGRFLPIGPENERYEAGLWRSSPEGNYYKTGHPSYEVIEKARENMHRKHPQTRFVNAHVAMFVAQPAGSARVSRVDLRRPTTGTIIA